MEHNNTLDYLFTPLRAVIRNNLYGLISDFDRHGYIKGEHDLWNHDFYMKWRKGTDAYPAIAILSDAIHLDTPPRIRSHVTFLMNTYKNVKKAHRISLIKLMAETQMKEPDDEAIVFYLLASYEADKGYEKADESEKDGELKKHLRSKIWEPISSEVIALVELTFSNPERCEEYKDFREYMTPILNEIEADSYRPGLKAFQDSDYLMNYPAFEAIVDDGVDLLTQYVKTHLNDKHFIEKMTNYDPCFWPDWRLFKDDETYREMMKTDPEKRDNYRRMVFKLHDKKRNWSRSGIGSFF